MAKLPITLEAGTADNILAKTGNIYDDASKLFVDQLVVKNDKEHSELNNKVNTTKTELVTLINTSCDDLDAKRKADKAELTDIITDEAYRAKAQENAIKADVQAKITDVNNSIVAETKRAEDAEAALSKTIDEKADIAETLITNEKNRAKQAEDNLQATINNIVDVSAQATTAKLVTTDPIADSTASNVQQALEEIFTDLNRTYDTDKGDLDISDPKGYVISRFVDGHIKTKNFDSSAISDVIAAGYTYLGIAGTDEDFLVDKYLPSEKGLFFIAKEADVYMAWNKPDGLEITEDEVPCIIKRAAKSLDWEKETILDGHNRITPKIADNVAADLDIADNSGNVITRFKDGEIQTKNFDSVNTPTQKDDDSLYDFAISDEAGDFIIGCLDGGIKTKEFDSSNTPSQKDTDDSAFAIADENGNKVIDCIDGNIRTKLFDSATTPKQIDDNSNTELSIADEEGNVIVKFESGNIQVKHFNSTNLYETKVENNDLILSAISAKVITTESNETLAIINGAYVENEVLYV